MKYYLTTPLYYVNAAPHIGHTYTTIAADVIRRFKQMQGYEAVMFTGTDEHGQKVERAAKQAGLAPEDYTTRVAGEFYRQWGEFGLKVDRTMRTTDPRHHKTVQWLFERCRANGYIYKGSYTGQYCSYDELYVSEAKPGDPCPDCGRPTETVTEENYFFKLSAFQERLLDFYEKNPHWIQPEARRNEVMSFVRKGLNDLSITRTSIKWGIPVPGEPNHVFYVWFDALIGYMSGVAGEEMWPADLHLIGKEIVRFHAVYWPAFLMAGDVPLPKRIFAHGWLLFEESKMSKSRGNIVRASPIREVMGADALRYFLLREIVFGQDGSFSYDALIGRYNAELANGLGNLASRTLTMIGQYRGGCIPPAGHSEISAIATETISAAVAAFENFEFSRGLEAIWGLLSSVDKYIVQQAPWKLAKKPEAQEQLDTALYTAAEALRIGTALLAPVLPDSAAKIWAQLGMPEPLESVRFDKLAWGQLTAGQKIGEVSARLPARGNQARGGEDARARNPRHGRAERAARQDAGHGGGSRAGHAEDPHRRFRQGGYARGAGAGGRAGEGRGEAAAPEGRYRGAAAAHTGGGHRVGLQAGAVDRPQGGHRGQPAAAEAARHRIERDDRGGLGRRRQPRAGRVPGRHAGRGALEVTLVDSHCHLDDERFDDDRERVIGRALEAGVTRMLAVGTGHGPPDLEAAIRLAEAFPFIWATAGVHPHDAAKAQPDTFERLRELLRHPKVVALGEIGLDYHYNLSPPEVQREVFRRQLMLAAEAGKPVVIHTREAWPDTLAVLREHWRGEGIMHCFSGGTEEARQALDLGFHLSFGGIVTFPKAQNIRDAARLTPEDRLLVETDAPYLAPVPHRGKRNEPAFLVEPCARWRRCAAKRLSAIAEATTRNFERLCLRREVASG